jgi:hypothetical protein
MSHSDRDGRAFELDHRQNFAASSAKAAFLFESQWQTLPLLRGCTGTGTETIGARTLTTATTRAAAAAAAAAVSTAPAAAAAATAGAATAAAGIADPHADPAFAALRRSSRRQPSPTATANTNGTCATSRERCGTSTACCPGCSRGSKTCRAPRRPPSPRRRLVALPSPSLQHILPSWRAQTGPRTSCRPHLLPVVLLLLRLASRQTCTSSTVASSESPWLDAPNAFFPGWSAQQSRPNQTKNKHGRTQPRRNPPHHDPRRNSCVVRLAARVRQQPRAEPAATANPGPYNQSASTSAT